MEALKTIDWKDLAVRAVWTFLQAFLAVFIIAGESIIDLLFGGDWEGLLTLLVATAVAATAAGLSALKTVIVEVIRNVRASN